MSLHPTITFQVNLQAVDAFSYLSPERYKTNQAGAIVNINANTDARSIGIPGVGFFKHGEKFTLCGQQAIQTQSFFANDPSVIVCALDDCVADIGDNVTLASASTRMTPVGSAVAVAPGAGYRVADELVVVGGTFTEVTTLIIASVKTVLAQDETNYEVAELNGTFTQGTGYLNSETLTMSDGTVVVVDVQVGGQIQEFHITDISTSAHTSDSDTITMSSSNGEPGGTGFTMTLDRNNQGIFATTYKLVGEVILGIYTDLPTDPVSVTPAGAVSSATFNLDWKVRDITLLSGGGGYASTPTVAFSGGGTGTVTGVTLTVDVVTNVAITSGGSGYTSLGVPTFSSP